MLKLYEKNQFFLFFSFFFFFFDHFLLAQENNFFDYKKKTYHQIHKSFVTENKFWWKSPVSLSPSEMYFHTSFFSRRLLHHNLSLLLSEFDDYSIYQLDSVGDFSFLEGHLYSAFGNSWRWNKYDLDGIDITDPFFPGRLLYALEPIAYDVYFSAEDGRISFRNRPTSHFFVKGLTSFAGGPLPYYKFLDKLANHRPAQRRFPPPTTVRRGQPIAMESDMQHVTPFYDKTGGFDIKNSKNLLGFRIYKAFFQYQRRFHLQFDEEGYDGRFAEDGFSSSFHFEQRYASLISKKMTDFAFGFLGAIKYRDKLYSDFYYRNDETAKLFLGSTTLYLRTTKENTSAFTVSVHDIVGNNLNSPGNFMRITGEGIDPYYPSMNYVTFKLDHHFRHYLKRSVPLITGALGYVNDDLFSFMGKFSNLVTIGNPKVKQWQKPIYFRSYGNEIPLYRSLYIMNFRSEPIYYALFDNSFGVSIGEEEKIANGFRYFFSFGMDLDGMVLDSSFNDGEKQTILENSHAAVSPYGKLGVVYLDKERYRFRLEIGRENIPYNKSFALFLTPGHISSRNFLWNDVNKNKIYDSASESSKKLHSTWGASSHKLDKSFRQPHYYYLSAPFNFLLPQNFVFSFSLHYRIFKKQPWVSFDGKDTSYGAFQTINGERVFIPHDGEKKYLVVNLPKSKFPIANFFNDSPFYAGGTLKAGWHNKKSLVSVSFSAYLINAATWLGNGPLNNSLGVLDESMAVYQKRNIGRLDADRSYVVRLLFAHEFHRYVFGSISLTYRDGQPFGAWSYYMNEENVSLGSHVGWVREKVNGDNILLYKGEFGQREDAIWNFDLRFLFLAPLPKQKEPLEIYLIFYNLIDLALEILEYTAYAEKIKNRAALETQHPRAIEVGFRYSF